MAHAHNDKENRPPKRKKRNPYEVIDPWSSRPATVKKGSSNTRLDRTILGPISTTLAPNFGTFSTSTAQKPRPTGTWTPLRDIWMPYNNTAIPPSEEITGSASLPWTQELFIRYLAEQAMNVVRTEKKVRRNIQYKDLANAVTRIDNLEFLSDVIPKTTTFREFKEKKTKTVKPKTALSTSQTTLDHSRSLPTRPADVINPTEAQPVDDSFEAEESHQEYGREATQAQTLQSHGEVVFEHYEPKGGQQQHYDSEDVEMG
ncbi:MAG: hypothetical protein Q9218_000599 [Villophora microphyllina]